MYGHGKVEALGHKIIRTEGYYLSPRTIGKNKKSLHDNSRQRISRTARPNASSAPPESHYPRHPDHRCCRLIALPVRMDWQFEKQQFQLISPTRQLCWGSCIPRCHNYQPIHVRLPFERVAHRSGKLSLSTSLYAKQPFEKVTRGLGSSHPLT